MESSVRTKNALQAELTSLRQRVAELENTLGEHDQALIQETAIRQTLELTLLEANHRIDKFLSITSHELRTPLTTINGNIQLAKRRLKTLIPFVATNDEHAETLNLVQELLSRAERQVQVQNKLVGDLLDVSRIQSNRLRLHIQQCELTTILYEAVTDQRSAAPERSISLDIPPDITIPVNADPGRIGQVIINYLTNALKYSYADSPVEVSVELKGEIARISVRDHGPGLPSEEQERIWQQFYRVPGIHIQYGSGTGLGLGLYICRVIIERHQGQVGVASSPGKGATFWFTLPITQH